MEWNLQYLKDWEKVAHGLGHDNMGPRIEWSEVGKGWDVIAWGLGH
jgi:hypothetical protein